jgi:hypothetical protein
MTFTNTWLMIKKHKITGLKYFCKTTGKDPIKYLGSGTYWKRHLKEHGNEVETVWCQLFDNKDEIYQFATNFSKENNIVDARNENGDRIWANLIEENGIDGGGNKNLPMSAEQKAKLTDTWEIITPVGEILILENMLEFCRNNKLNASAMSAVARGNKGHYKKYKCRKLTNNRNIIYEFKEKRYLTDDEKSKINSDSVKKTKRANATPKIKYNGVIYNTLVEAIEATGISRHLLIKHGELLRNN